MSIGGTTIRDLRKRAGLSLQELADRIYISKTYLWDIEKGNRQTPPPDKLIRQFERVLRRKQGELQAKFDEDRKAHVQAIASPLDNLTLVENYVNRLAIEAIKGCRRGVVDESTALIESLQHYLKVASASDQPYLKRPLTKALISRVVAQLEVPDNAEISKRVKADLGDIWEGARFLDDEDLLFRSIAIALPAMVFYVQGKVSLADQWLDENLVKIQHPLILALALRDQMVIAGIRQDHDKYRRVVKQTDGFINQGNLGKLGQAQAYEGRARVARQLSLPNGQKWLATAQDAYADAEMSGETCPIFQAQIYRTAVELALAATSFDPDFVLAIAERAARHFKTSGYLRYLKQLKRLLMGTGSKQLLAWAGSL